jgi:endonuclease/exonuclease/phosphatase family metal-dependent hydrolase
VSVPTPLRIATFNLENFDDVPKPSLATRVELMQPELVRLRADVLCLQEVYSQDDGAGGRNLRALDALLAGTPYAAYNRVVTAEANGMPSQERNQVILSRFAVLAQQQIHNHAMAPSYRRLTAAPPDAAAVTIDWERPILMATVDLGDGRSLHVINLHLKSKLPTEIPGQKINQFTWRNAAAAAEGSFLSSMKRVGQALETRLLVESLFDADAHALIAVCGDFNSDITDVPVTAIRGDIADTGNPALADRVLLACERSVPEPSRFSLIHQGRGEMIDHILVSRGLLAGYETTQVQNELVHDESIAFATDELYPESDHAPVVASFVLP